MQDQTYERETENQNSDKMNLAEIAILGAAGFVLWSNREKIKGILEENGITAGSFLPTQITDWLRQGADLFSSPKEEEEGQPTRRQHVPPPPPSRRHRDHRAH